MSQLGDAFQELREEFDRVTGQENKVRISGKPYPAIVEDVSFETIVANDGNGEAGGFRAMVALQDHPKKPKQGADIEARGLKVSILSVENVNNVTWIIVAGDPAIE